MTVVSFPGAELDCDGSVLILSSVATQDGGRKTRLGSEEFTDVDSPRGGAFLRKTPIRQSTFRLLLIPPHPHLVRFYPGGPSGCKIYPLNYYGDTYLK
jgi:hypothetical protein